MKKQFFHPRVTDPRRDIPTSAHAFTLVEMLVVVCVIAVLIALSVSGVQYARNTAKRMGDISNLRQIGLIIFQYAIDNEGTLPPANRDGWRILPMALEPYLNPNTQALSKGANSIFVSPAAQIPMTVQWYRLTYSAHSSLFGDDSYNGKKPYKIQQIQHPSTVILLANGPQIASSGGNTTATFWNPAGMSPKWSAGHSLTELVPVGPNTDATETKGYFRYLHFNNTAMNALMADGHVETFKIGTVTFENVIFDR